VRGRAKSVLPVVLAGCSLAFCPIAAWGAQGGSRFDVTSYGAVSDGTTPCTRAIQQAIDACAGAGGGIVFFPPGRYLTGTLSIKNNVTLDLEANAILLGSRELAHYDPPYLIYAGGVQNISITGRGTIDGQGEVFWRGKERPYQRPSKMISLEDCKNVRVQGITITNSPNWTLNLSRCDGVFIEGITIFSPRDAPNTDGIDPCSCSNVFISNCHIDTGDDAICLKSYEEDRPCENIVVSNCVLASDDAALKFGTGSHGSIEHCVFSNIVIRDSKCGIGLFMKDGGSFQDIQFSNVNIETLKLSGPTAEKRSMYPIFIDIEPRGEMSALGTIRNVAFQDVVIQTQNGNCLIQGDPKRPLEDITFESVRMRLLSRAKFSGRSKPRGNRLLTEKSPNDHADMPAHFAFANIKGLTVRNLFIRDDAATSLHERHAVWGSNLSQVMLDGFNNRNRSSNKELADLLLRNCRDVLIRGCQPSDSATPFLRLEGDGTDRVTVVGNDLSASGTAFEFADGDLKSKLYESDNRLPAP